MYSWVRPRLHTVIGMNSDAIISSATTITSPRRYAETSHLATATTQPRVAPLAA